MKQIIRTVLIVIFSVMLAVSGYFIVRNYLDEKKINDLYGDIAEKTESASDDAEESNTVKPEIKSESVEPEKEKPLLSEYAELYEQNSDMVGWVCIEDTNINYPVVQSKNDPDFYLKHDFNKKKSDYGCPYVQANCDVNEPSDNIMLYGHHMRNGTMFADLEKFERKSFWKKHKTFTFNTLKDKYEYEIVAVFKTVVYTDSPDAFRYYDFVNAKNPNEFTAYVQKCKELSLYDTGVYAEYGDKLITLSTCEYSNTNGRLVLVAKRLTAQTESNSDQ